ncbi:N-6 DNA methylase [Actinomyces minihominis]|uniref:N-6 DNA methylase n=1 Tax=Actinomyces minihominis TaxID=2002838 RepID=UPI0013EB5CA1|nr:N-6 DNA methylase [Actinomyces minihominis]
MNRSSAVANWKSALAGSLSGARPDLAQQLTEHLGATAMVDSPLAGMTIGELGVVYEGLLAHSDHEARRAAGQYFTPDDVSLFMVSQAARFPGGSWLDPACGVGNLSWHLTRSQQDPSAFLTEQLHLVDKDEVALASAQAILTAAFARPDGEEVLPALVAHSRAVDFLDEDVDVGTDYVLMNPPYGRCESRDYLSTAHTRELYAYFLEKAVRGSKGVIAITPSSFLGGAKYGTVRRGLETRRGRAYVFDNVPDTVFSGVKYGSENSSKANFVRSCITVVLPGGPASGVIGDGGINPNWQVTPIIRWRSTSRKRMWREIEGYLVPLRHGPAGDWARIMPGTERLWDSLWGGRRMSDLLTREQSAYPLWVASTPRYYISASARPLDRKSQHVLFFPTSQARDKAYLALNSSLSYWWWRCLDGGITLQKRTLTTLPLPESLDRVVRERPDLVQRLVASDTEDLKVKLNAGRKNENVRRPSDLIAEIDQAVLPEVPASLQAVFAQDMFAA